MRELPKRIFVAGILTDNNKVLLVKRTSTDHEMGGLWSLPAGGVNERESLETAIPFVKALEDQYLPKQRFEELFLELLQF